MNHLDITLYPAPVLAQRAREVEEVDDDILELAPNMAQAMEAHDGVGLAAPQVGVSQRIIVVKDGERNHAFVNPKIVSRSRETLKEEEGCLSLPGLFVEVKRADKVEVVAQTPEGEKVTLKAEGLAARIFQHEIDHLDGRLITSRIPFWRRWRLRKELGSIKEHGHV